MKTFIVIQLVLLSSPQKYKQLYHLDLRTQP